MSLRQMHMQDSRVVECNEETSFKKQRNQANCSQHYCFEDPKHYQNWFVISCVFHFNSLKICVKVMYKHNFFQLDHLWWMSSFTTLNQNHYFYQERNRIISLVMHWKHQSFLWFHVPLVSSSLVGWFCFFNEI